MGNAAVYQSNNQPNSQKLSWCFSKENVVVVSIDKALTSALRVAVYNDQTLLLAWWRECSLNVPQILLIVTVG